MNSYKFFRYSPFLLFFILFFYNPSILSEVINPFFRFFSLLSVTFILFFSYKKFSNNDLVIFLLIYIFIFNILLGDDLSEINFFNVTSYLLSIFFAWSIYRFFNSNSFLRYWVIFSYKYFFIFMIFCIPFSYLYHYIFGSYDLFNILKYQTSIVSTPFGLLIPKSFGSFIIHRSFFYFIEPIHIGIFFATNIYIFYKSVKFRSYLFLIANLIGGFFTFSVFFYLQLLFTFFINSKNIFKYVFCILLISLMSMDDFLFYTSFGDRVDRMIMVVDFIIESDPYRIFFGNGFMLNFDDPRSINSGLLISLFQTGIIGTLVLLCIFYFLINNLSLFLLFIFTSLVLDPIRMPLFLFLLIMGAFIIKNKANFICKPFE